MHKEIKFLINPSEIAAGTRGASAGPYALMTAARNKGSFLFGEHEVQTIKDMNHLLDRPAKHQHAKNIEGVLEVYKYVSEAVSNILADGKFPFVLGADHGSAGGTIAGIRKAFPGKRLGVIWIDAHSDIHSPYTTPSGNMHGMPLSTALNEDNIPCKSNEVSAETVELWNQLKSLNGIQPKILPQDLVFVGVRDTEFQEDAMMKRLNIRNITIEEVSEKGTSQVVKEALQLLSACDVIYISFDVDSLDPDAVSYGTGTPVSKGLLPEQAREILLGLAESSKTVCIEFVEINPFLDEKKNKMAETAFELLEPLVKQLDKTKTI